MSTPDQELSLLAIRPNQVQFDNEQKTALIDVLRIKHATDADLAFFFHLCRQVQLDPFRRQVYLIARQEYNTETNQKEWRQTVQTGIDGYRVVAERSAARRGLRLKKARFEYFAKGGTRSDAWWENEPPAMIRATVQLGDEEPVTWDARWSEYVPMTDETEWQTVDGKNKKVKTGKQVPQGMWKKRPTAMLEKCAEAGALRRACPEDLSGIYVVEEMGANPEDVPVTTMVDDGSGAPTERTNRNWAAETDAAQDAPTLREIYTSASRAGELTPQLKEAIVARGKVLAAAEEQAKAEEPETSEVSEPTSEVSESKEPEGEGEPATAELPEDLCPSCGAAPDQEHSESCEIPVGEGE